MAVDLTVEQVDRLMEAIDKIDRLIELVDPPPRPPRTRIVTRYVEREPRPAVDIGLLARSIESRLLLLDALGEEAVAVLKQCRAVLAPQGYSGVVQRIDRVLGRLPVAPSTVGSND